MLVYTFEVDDSPEIYSFDDTIPVGISGGRCSIDFRSIKDRLENASKTFGDKW